MKEKRAYAEGLKTALRLIAYLQPYCERIEIAGSLRRRCQTVGDIELVAIPKKRTTASLFGPVVEDLTWLDIHLNQNPDLYTQVRSGNRLKELRFQGFQVDLFLTNPARWGVTFTLRTGSADFSKWLVTSRLNGGARVLDRYVKDCRVWQMGQRDPLETPEEADVFHWLGAPWIPPEMRDTGYWGQDVSGFRFKKGLTYV